MGSVLVTGGSGLIGWRAVELLLERGHEVVVYDVNPAHENLAGLRDRAPVVGGDVTDLARLLTAMKQHHVERVLHLAAVISEQAGTDPASAFRVNTLGTTNVFDAALALDVERVVWTSSVTALAVADGYANEPVGEEHPIITSGAYGASKHGAEVIAAIYRRSRGLDAIGIRPAMVYGIGRLGGGTGLFNAAVRRMALGERAGFLGSATLHQPMYNRDAAELLTRALTVQRPEHDIFNIPVERDYTDAEVLEVMRRVCPEAEVWIDPIPDYIPRVPVVDGSRARRELGFAPRYSLEDGVREMVELYRAAA